MLKKGLLLLPVLAFICVLKLTGQAHKTSFNVVPLGVKGGLDESNLSAYLIAPEGSSNYICFDAGTLHYGIKKAVENKVFNTSAEQVLKKYVKGYLISHAHLDHVAGLIINSPEDSTKNIYGLPKVLNVLRDKYFTWDSWANFANEGEKPALKKYIYTYLEENKEVSLSGTEMTVRAFTLSHSNPYQSTAFLVKSNDSYALYLGDTGEDDIENSDKLQVLCQQVAPLIKEHRLKAIFLEVSFPNKQPDNLLFGHLTPALFMKELFKLSQLTGKSTLRDVSFIVTHIKPSGNNEQKIRVELERENTLHLKLIYPQQGKLLKF